MRPMYPMCQGWLAFVACITMACAPSPEDGNGNGSGGDGGAVENADADPLTPPPVYPDAAPNKACDKMDILFVIDNSGSMQEEQDNLAANFPAFIDVLDTFMTDDGTPIDYRVALTSTGRDMTVNIEVLPGWPMPEVMTGENGELLQRCDMTRRWLEREDPNVSGTFSCAAALGINGPGIEMPLYAVKLAFDERIADGTNVGFLRDDALLAIVILTDEDDCSREDDNFTVTMESEICQTVEPVSRYNNFLNALTGAPGRWAVAVIAGPGPGTCSSDFGDAVEATRLKELVSMVGNNAVFSSICDGDLAGALEAALDTFDTACESFPPVD